MFRHPKDIVTRRPQPFEFYTAKELWTDPHIAKEMLKFHLDNDTELASRNSGFIDRSVEWIVQHFRISEGTRICDLGCGPGLYASRLAGKGAKVTGVDFSQNSLQYARTKAAEAGLEIEYIHADYLEHIPSEPFDLLMLIYCDFCALGPRQRNSLLDKMKSVLAPKGKLLFDVCSTQLYDETEESREKEKYPEGGFWTSEPHYVFLSVFKYPEERLLLHKHTIIQQGKTKDIYNWVQCYTVDSIRAELESAGFEVAEFFSNVGGEPWVGSSKEIAVVANLMQ
jgi:SAM-dependent methyltransferase